MKLRMLGIAGVLSVLAMVPGVASAQRWDDRGGWNDRGWNDRRGWDDRRDWRDDRRRWRDDRRAWRDDRRRWRQDRRYANNWGGSRARTVCRWEDGYYGPVRRCFRVRR